MNRLRKVTISGADDQVKVADLIVLAKEYPFVEFGILASPNNFGRARYPNKEWIIELWMAGINKQLSLHLCGDFARMFATKAVPELEGKTLPYLIDELVQFERCQINLAKEIDTFDIPHLVGNIKKSRCREFIIQLNPGSGDLMKSINRGLGYVNYINPVHPFMDVSGGNGQPGVWTMDVESNYVGFAGGITLANVDGVIATIEKNLRPNQQYWIDMESGVRNNDQFSLDLAEGILKRCYSFTV